MPGTRTTIVVLALAIVAIVLVAMTTNPDLLRFWPFSATDFVQMMTPLILVALFVERALEIVIKGLYGQGEEMLRHQAKANPAMEAHRVQYKAHTRKVAFTTALLMCIAIAAVGVRALGQLVDPAVLETLTGTQRAVFASIDIMLTGTLLAGGADGLHKLVTLFTNTLDAQNAKLKQ
jgi:hypothetical protein